MDVELSRIFVFPDSARTYSLWELQSFPVRVSFCTAFGEQIGLVYDEAENGEGRVCFARASELRPAYKTVFTKADVIRYVTAQLGKNGDVRCTTPIPLPQHAADFWAGTGG